MPITLTRMASALVMPRGRGVTGLKQFPPDCSPKSENGLE